MASTNHTMKSPSSFKVPVYVMLPLDAVDPITKAVKSDLTTGRQLELLKIADVDGVMLDVWWGICEPQPGVYDFNSYLQLFQYCHAFDLKVQAIMSFHQCGGNVGDDVNVSLPEWVLAQEDTVPELFYRAQNSEPSHEYISLSCDHLPCLPSDDGDRKRTALECYEAYMRAFKQAAAEYINNGTVIEIQVGTGPCGELRYPSYQLSKGWSFPHIGSFQCFDAGMLNDLKNIGIPNTDDVLVDLPEDTNMIPDKTVFFKQIASTSSRGSLHFENDLGRLFLDWYARKLQQHGNDVLYVARKIFGPDMELAVKIAGIHWQTRHMSKAAECTAGYYGSLHALLYVIDGNYFDNMTKVFAVHNAILDFTCLEKVNLHEDDDALAEPERLVEDAMIAARNAGIKFAGENAQSMHGTCEEWDQIVRHYMNAILKLDVKVHGCTILRLTADMVDLHSNLFMQLCRFVCLMHNISETTASRLRPHDAETCNPCAARQVKLVNYGTDSNTGRLEEDNDIERQVKRSRVEAVWFPPRP